MNRSLPFPITDRPARPTRHLTIIGCLALATTVLANAAHAQLRNPGTPRIASPSPGATLVNTLVNPCKIAPPDTLEKYFDMGIDTYFPIEAHQEGHHVKVKNPNVTAVICPTSPPMTIRVEVKTEVKYQDTRGLVQYETSGHARLRAPLRLLVQYWSTPGQPVKPSDIKEARTCFTEVAVYELNLNNVPNWLDNDYLKNKLQSKLVPTGCVLVTALIRLYVAAGGTF